MTGPPLGDAGASPLDVAPLDAHFVAPPDAAVDALRPDAAMAVCEPGTTRGCYAAPRETQDVGACRAGVETCASDGSGYGDCVGAITPRVESCATPGDDDCDGTPNEDCVCEPGTSRSCYSGPGSTRDVGACRSGLEACADDGLSYRSCEGELLPHEEDCSTLVDDDCDGEINEGCACTPGTSEVCYSGPAGSDGVSLCHAGTHRCNAEGTGFGPCTDEVVPSPETCANAIDDDCDGLVNEEGAECVCTPGSTSPCYEGPLSTAGVGACALGMHTCNELGTAYGECVGQVLPAAETCATLDDDDCDGLANEEGALCVCMPGTSGSCYSGAAGTAGVGLCRAGTRVCNEAGTAYGACAAEVVPVAESCSTAGDDDCDGAINEGCALSYAIDVQPIFTARCGPCHTTGSSGGLRVGMYAHTQLAASSCASATKGACALTRILSGSMPRGAGCTGDPALDAGNARCLTAAEQATIRAWIDGGQQP